MLLEFETENYRSFKNKLCFSMLAAPKQKGLDYSVHKKQVAHVQYKVLCSGVLYGPNAGGKSNVISAMDTFRSIVLRGHIHNTNSESWNAARDHLELIPNRDLSVKTPVSFRMKAMENGVVVEYGFSMMLGEFLSSSDRKITREELIVNENRVFLREEQQLRIHDLDGIRKWMMKDYQRNLSSACSLAQQGLNEEELFLMNGFKVLFSPRLVSGISDYLNNRFMVIYRANEVQPEPTDEIKDSKILTAIAKEIGAGENELRYVRDENTGRSILCSVLPDGKTMRTLPADAYESLGTIRFVTLFPLVVRAFQTGATLVVDEFDASIHPMVLMNIVNLFHNDEINTNHAQLIFNTHDPIFLNSNLFRRDEIHFVERGEDGGSEEYTLADFKTSGKSGVRKGEDYMKNYFVNRYGALKNTDFTELMKQLN